MRAARPLTALAVAFLLVASAAVPGETSAAANDPLFGEQWALTQIRAPEAWSVATGKGITIGVVDTGVDLGHEDLVTKIDATTNCIGANGDPSACSGSGQDDNGHGTHVSGIAAAATNNGKGIAGVAPDARLVVAKALDQNGSGSSADVAAGIRWVVAHGAHVVNLSLGDLVPASIFSDPTFDQAVNDAWHAGAIPVIAAGNATAATSAGYGNLDAVVVVATGPNDQPPYYSSSAGNARWGIAAPGGEGNPLFSDPAHDIISTYWIAGESNQYATLAGTSMAAPHVSGVLALLLSEGLTPSQAVDRLLSTADPIACGPGCRGRVDAARAVGPGPGPANPPSTAAVAPPAATQDAPATVSAPAASSAPAGAGASQNASATPSGTAPLSAPPVPPPARRGTASVGRSTTTAPGAPRDPALASPSRAAPTSGAQENGGHQPLGTAPASGSTGTLALVAALLLAAGALTYGVRWRRAHR